MANKIRIITVGKAHDAKLREAIADYEQRLAPTKVVWHVLPPKTEASVAETIASESYAIASTLKEAEYIVVLDERGETLTSEAFSAKIISALATHKDFSFVIGGAYGVNDAVRKRANLVVCFGKMVFPHQLMRLMLIEQLYRAASIANGSKYHHGG